MFSLYSAHNKILRLVFKSLLELVSTVIEVTKPGPLNAKELEM